MWKNIIYDICETKNNSLYSYADININIKAFMSLEIKFSWKILMMILVLNESFIQINVKKTLVLQSIYNFKCFYYKSKT